MNNLMRRKAIIWDFDGVVYSYHDPVPLEVLCENFYRANAYGAHQNLPFLSLEQAREIAIESYQTHHDTVTAFERFTVQSGISEKDLKSKILRSQAAEAYRIFSEGSSELFTPCAETLSYMEVLQEYMRHIVVTHYCATNWSKPVSKHLGLFPYFEEVLGYEELAFQNKGKSANAVKKGLNTLGLNPENVIFIEDNPDHLAIAKQAYPDIFTVLVDGFHEGEIPSHVDMSVSRPKDFLKKLADAKVKKAA